jgi:hypothetical protein
MNLSLKFSITKRDLFTEFLVFVSNPPPSHDLHPYFFPLSLILNVSCYCLLYHAHCFVVVRSNICGSALAMSYDFLRQEC